MLLTRMARAPMSYSASMIRLVSFLGTIERTATQSESRSGEMVGYSSPGVRAAASSTSSLRTS